MLKIWEDQQGNLVPGKLSVVEESPEDVQSPKLEGTVQPELCREQGPAQAVGVTFEQGQTTLLSRLLPPLLLCVHMDNSQKHKGTAHPSSQRGLSLTLGFYYE